MNLIVIDGKRYVRYVDGRKDFAVESDDVLTAEQVETLRMNPKALLGDEIK